MIVLGITETHCATAAILKDGAVVGCASEERFSRLKNDAGYPRRAIDALLRECRIAPSEIDLVTLAGSHAYAREWMNRVLHDAAYAREYYGVRLEEPARGFGKRARKLGARLGIVDRALGKFEVEDSERRSTITRHLGVGNDQIVALDHHACHAAAAYFGSPFRGAPALVLTNDNSGDGLCATVSTAQAAALTRHEATPSAPGSLGAFYSFVTLLLGMKFGEHEYKVMGLAPYAPARAADRAEAVLREVFDLTNGAPARFEWKRRGPRYRVLLEATLGQRFDAIAAGAQRIVEDALGRWAQGAHERHGGERVAAGGGVFMNVKANMLLAAQEWVREIFVFPSCGDESNAVGAAYLGYVDLCARAGVAATPQPFGPAYLGPALHDADIETVIRKRDLAGRFKVREHEEVESHIADLLVSDGVVARCAGRMEFGARALGNRSILANPSDHRVVTIINTMIKNRDFWMPFAPSILREREADYIVNPKGLSSPYMMLAFPTNPARREQIVAAVHPQDGTARAHLVDEAWNPGYHRLLRAFESRTGIGAVLNTSFNLHGEPLVCSPDDAIDTFERSGLPHLALGRWIISKK
jgi:carbamoyltransferase